MRSLLAKKARSARGTVPWIHGLVALLAAVFPGCNGDECELGQVRCRNNVAEYCDYSYSDGSAPLVWIGEDCGEGVCKAGLDERPFCALADDPDPRCDESPSRPVCDEETLVSCRHGYATAITDCATAGAYCVTADAGGLCAADPAPSELCPDEPYATTCDGDTLVTCSYGYVGRREPCAAGEQCVVTPGYAMCREGAEPDPLCPPASPLARVCNGNAIVECVYGYRDALIPCGAGQVCEQEGTAEQPEAFCVEAE